MLVALGSVIGIILAIAAAKAARTAPVDEAEESVETGRTHTVVDLMKTDVYALSTDQNADGSLAGFLSDRDVMRYLSAEHPSSINIYSFAFGESDDLKDALANLVSLPVMRLPAREVVTVDASASIADAVLSDKHLKKVPVVRGENGPVLGIVSRSAVNRLAISSYLAPPTRAGPARRRRGHNRRASAAARLSGRTSRRRRRSGWVPSGTHPVSAIRHRPAGRT